MNLRNQKQRASNGTGGTRASARFNVHCGAMQEMPGPLPIRALKRRERRAPSPVGRWTLDVGRWTFLFFWLFALSGIAQQTNRTTSLEYPAFRVISERNIFNPNRTPQRIQSARTPTRTADYLSLVGTMIYDTNSLAFFEGSSSSYKKVLKQDGEVAGFKIAAISPSSVKLSGHGKDLELKVGTQLRHEGDEWYPTDETIADDSRNGRTRRRNNFPSRQGSSEGSSTNAISEEDMAVIGTLIENVAELSTAETPTTAVPETDPAETPEGAPIENAQPADTTTETDPVILRLMQQRNATNPQ